MKKIFLLTLLFFPIQVISQTYSLSEVCDLFQKIAVEMENGAGMSKIKLGELSGELKKISFSPIQKNLIRREDHYQTDSTALFLYLPEFLDSLLKNGYARSLAESMYNRFKKKGKKGTKGNVGTSRLYQSVQILKASKTAKIRIQINNQTEIAVVAQPFARISVRFYDDEDKDVTGTDPNKNKGYLKAIQKFYKNGTYWTTIQIKNLTEQDICFTILSD